MRFFAILLITACLSGCNILPKSAAVHDFGLYNLHPPTRSNHVSQTDTLSVEAPKWLYDTRIRYRQLYVAPTQVKFYALDRWLAPPPELFEQLLLADDLGTGQAFTVYLMEFEQHFTRPDQAKVVMSFSVTLPKSAAKPEKTQEFRLERICPSADAKGAIAAFSALTHNAAQQIGRFLQP